MDSLDEREWIALQNIARAFSYFARMRAYGYIDRLANVFSTTSLRQVLVEALRDLKSEFDRGERIFMPTSIDVENFIKIAEKDLSLVKVAMSIALASSWWKEEKKEENTGE